MKPTISNMFLCVKMYAFDEQNHESRIDFINWLSSVFTKNKYGKRWLIALNALLALAED